MKLLLLSDVHFGVKKNSEFFIDVTRNFFSEIITPTIKQENISQLWILGDMFDDKIITNNLIQNVALTTIRKLLTDYPSLEIKIVIGNHDIYYKSSLKVTSLKAFEKINKRLEVIKTVNEYNIDGCKIVAVPWLIHGSENWISFKQIVTTYEETNKQTHDFCFGHFPINGFEKIKGVLEQDGLSQDLFKPFGKVYSGHFHIRNKINNIQFLGSPYEITWNDFGTPKGITIIDTKKKSETFIENTISPKHKHIKLSSVLEDMSIVNEATNNMVRFHIDKAIKEDEMIAIVERLEHTKTFNLQFIDERYDNTIDNDETNIEHDNTDDLQYCLEYAEKLQHPSEIEVNELKTRLAELYQKALQEILDET
jgi:hypothetical protein